MMEHHLILEPGRKKSHYWRDLWHFRELFFFLTWRDVAVRYKQTLLGVGWAVIQPLITMLIFTVIFGRIAKLEEQTSVPYGILVLTGVLPWQLFTTILNNGSTSLVASARLFTKVYFPRLLIPFSVVGVALLDFAISIGLFLAICAGYAVMQDSPILFSPRLLLLPFLVLFTCASAMAVALWFATLNVRFRDFRIIMPFVVQFGVFITPVGYSSKLMENYPLLTWLNPMAQVIDGFRWALLGAETTLTLPKMLVSILLVGILLWGAIRYFRSVEDRLADVV
ncbi:MAG: ABC transporter permease [Candidatus Sumerlaeia bacterium]|nr:ABC transporter permease [Candidatus Sumerlaeia bacterium]